MKPSPPAGIEGWSVRRPQLRTQTDSLQRAEAPGLVDTPLGQITSNSAAASARLHALGRIGSPSDVAPMAALLLDPTTRGRPARSLVLMVA